MYYYVHMTIQIKDNKPNRGPRSTRYHPLSDEEKRKFEKEHGIAIFRPTTTEASKPIKDRGPQWSHGRKESC